MRSIVAFCLALGACAAPAPPTQAQEQTVAPPTTGTPGVDAPQPTLRQVPLTIRTAAGRTHDFLVEVAATPEQQSIGMMFRRELAPDRGMLFPYERPGELGFWMRNTLIPLDLVFIRENGTVARILTGRPLDETSLRSGEPAIAVLELAGGRAAELGIGPGDRVTSSALPPSALPTVPPRG